MLSQIVLCNIRLAQSFIIPPPIHIRHFKQYTIKLQIMFCSYLLLNSNSYIAFSKTARNFNEIRREQPVSIN